MFGWSAIPRLQSVGLGGRGATLGGSRSSPADSSRPLPRSAPPAPGERRRRAAAPRLNCQPKSRLGRRRGTRNEAGDEGRSVPMRRFLMIALVSAVLLVLAATVLVARSGGGGGGGDERHDASAAERPATTSVPRARPAPAPTTPTITAAPMAAAAPAPADDPQFVCPDGGMDAVVALQQAWEDGHQPWLGSAPDVAAACTFGVPESLVEPVGAHRYRYPHDREHRVGAPWSSWPHPRPRHGLGRCGHHVHQLGHTSDRSMAISARRRRGRDRVDDPMVRDR